MKKPVAGSADRDHAARWRGLVRRHTFVFTEYEEDLIAAVQIGLNISRKDLQSLMLREYAARSLLGVKISYPQTLRPYRAGRGAMVVNKRK